MKNYCWKHLTWEINSSTVGQWEKTAAAQTVFSRLLLCEREAASDLHT